MALTWKCACGQFTAEMKSQPFLMFNCHCHSCVAPARYLDAKFGPTTRSALDDSGGTAKAFFYLKDVVLAAGNPPLRYLRVGERGTVMRSFTSCCGTLFNTAGGAIFPMKGARPFSRNNLFNTDGSRFNPGPVPDALLKHSFTDYARPDNGLVFDRSLFAEAVKATATDNVADYDPCYFQAPDADTETVPITWPQKSKL